MVSECVEGMHKNQLQWGKRELARWKGAQGDYELVMYNWIASNTSNYNLGATMLSTKDFVGWRSTRFSPPSHSAKNRPSGNIKRFDASLSLTVMNGEQDSVVVQ